jgi:F-type H+-transporting ATPase subunit b
MHLLAFAESIQLFPDGTLVVHVALILLMIYILNRTLYRPINRVLEAREKNKGGYFGEAEQILSSVGEKEARYNKELLDARSTSYELIEREQRAAVEARERDVAAAKAEVAGQIESGKAEIDKQIAAARATIESDAQQMADKIAAGILKVQ